MKSKLQWLEYDRMLLSQASSLAELFLLPGVPIFERRNAGQQNASSQPDYGLHGEDYAGGGGEDWDDEPGFSEGTAEGAWQSSTAAADLIEAPRKVAQIGINYARASKQVCPCNICSRP